MDEAVVDKIVARILAQLNNEPVSSIARKVTMLFCGARAGTEAGLEAVRRLSRSKHDLTVMHTEAAREIIPEETIRKAGANDFVGAGLWVDVAGLVCKSDLLLVPTLTTRMAGHLALGLMESSSATLILRMLLAGKPVIVIKDGADPNGWVSEKIYGAKAGAASALRNRLESNLATLTSFGVDLVAEKDFLVTMERRLLTGSAVNPVGCGAEVPATPTSATDVMSGIVTAGELLRRAHGATVRIAPGSRLTPQAEDTVRQLRLKLVFA